MSDIAVETYRDLLEKLSNLSEEQLNQPIQVVKGHPVDEYVYALEQAICFASVDELELRYARSVTDNRRHGDHLVIFTDGNPYGECGAIAYEMKDGGFDSLKDNPIYPKNHDPSCDWTGPAQTLADQTPKKEPTDNVLREILKHRLDHVDK